MTVLRSIDNADRKAGGDRADHPVLDRQAHRLVTSAVSLVVERAARRRGGLAVGAASLSR